MKKRIIKLTVALCMLLAVLSMSVMAVAAGSEPYLEVTRDGYTCTVIPRNVPEGSAVYFASYAENGQMLEAELWTVNAESHAFTAPENTNYVKAFLMNTTSNEPLSEEREVSFLLEIPASVFNFGETESKTFTYDRDYEPKEQEPTYSFKAEDGAAYKKNEFTFQYKRQGNSEYEAGKPANAGTYDVTVTRAADDTYAAFEHTYENVLVINKGKHYNGVMEFVDIKMVNRGYTWFEFEVVPTGYAKPTEGATITYYVSADKLTWYRSEENSNRVRLPEHLGCDWNVRVEITNDPNWEDWTSNIWNSYYGTPYQLLPYPTTSWKDHWNLDWLDWNKTEQILTTAEHLSAFAGLVNEGVPFEGMTFYLGADIDLIGHKWEPIGNDTTQFKGVFDGQGHTISNLYIDDDVKYAGLFGYTSGDDTAYAQVKNVTLVESQIAGRHKAECAGAIVARAKSTQIENCFSSTKVSCNKEGSAVGGIVGLAERVTVAYCNNEGKIEGMGNVGGIVGKTTGSATNMSEIYDCINRGDLGSAGTATGGIVGNLAWTQVFDCASYGSIDGRQGTGGIVGTCSGNKSEIVNCLHYGEVKATIGNPYGTGGIVGIVNAGKVYNCANIYGSSVRGYSSVGGIVGLNYEDGRVYNCYSAGTVYGSAKYSLLGDGMYTGAIVGRNKDNDGWVTNCYYLAGSASNRNGDAGGAGTKKGSTDSEDHLSIGWFKGWVTNVESYWYGNGQAPLIDILNRWQGDYVNNGYIIATWWVPSSDGYPIPYQN